MALLNLCSSIQRGCGQVPAPARQDDPVQCAYNISHPWHQQSPRDISIPFRRKRLDDVLTPFSETPTQHFIIQLCSQIHILGCIPEMYVRHEVLSVSPSHNTSGLRRSLMDRSEGGGEEKAEQRKMKEERQIK